MKKILSALLSITLLLTTMCLSACAAGTTENTTILLQVGNTQMQVNGQSQTLDSEPVIVNDRTLVPIRVIIEAMGGSVSWEQSNQTATLNYGADEIRLTIDSFTAYFNNAAHQLDTAPAIINDRTMLPIRFIAESFNFNVEWNADTQEITITENLLNNAASTPAPTEQENDTVLPLSDMMVRITYGNTAADFQLYDTEAAAELYAQLPLTLDTTNFSSAQWMFYPPEKLAVKDSEAYHDGKKGELSYYEPWGDVFMLYKDFYAGDEMHRLGVCVNGVENIEAMSGTITVEKISDTNNSEVNTMDNQIKLTIGSKTLTAMLVENSSTAALKEMLSNGDITIDMSDYANFEKVGSLGASLPTNNEQISTEAGDLILYQGNSLVIYYDTNSWNFTRLGKIDNVTQAELKEILGNGNVTVTLSLK